MPRISTRLSASAPPQRAVNETPQKSRLVEDFAAARGSASELGILLPQALADDLRRGVHHESEEEQQEGGEKERAVERAAERRFGDLDRDVRGERAEAVEGIEVEDRRVAGRHEH